MLIRYLNLGCGGVFVDSPEWLNLDYVSNSVAVTQANLSEPLPIPTNSVEVVYSSHFLEHVPLDDVTALLDEIFRVLKPGGKVRLVLPDLENIAREYIQHLDAGASEKAFFCVVEMIDQCVRKASGGVMRPYISRDERAAEISQDVRAFAEQRVGHEVRGDSPERRNYSIGRIIKAAKRRISNLRIATVLRLLPADFVRLNVSRAAIGELHQWVWDFPSLHAYLSCAGFENISREHWSTTKINDFPIHLLDCADELAPRKGLESMYVEASKPLESSVLARA